MPERIFSKIENPENPAKNEPPEEELANPQEQPFQEPEAEQKPEQQESIETEFAKELENTPKGGFRKKITKIAAAFALAGYLMGAGEAIAPQATEESKGVYDIDYTREHQPELYKKVLEQIKEKGGIITSPQLPEMLYRPEKIAEIAKEVAEKSEKPFYNKPEVILGEKFVRENPEKTKEYMEKISTAIKATVRIELEDGIGSGVIVKSGNKKFILTNAHVCGENSRVDVHFSNNASFNLKVMAMDEENDIAMIEVPEATEALLKETEALELEKGQGSNIKRMGETIASIGNPLGFPFAVGICTRAYFPGQKKWLNYFPDKRFENLELYTIKHIQVKKGPSVFYERANISIPKYEFVESDEDFRKTGAIPGMSGGPIISLDTKGKPQLSGIVKGATEIPTTTIGYAVPAEKINEFLKEKGMM